MLLYDVVGAAKPKCVRLATGSHGHEYFVLEFIIRLILGIFVCVENTFQKYRLIQCNAPAVRNDAPLPSILFTLTSPLITGPFFNI